MRLVEFADPHCPHCHGDGFILNEPAEHELLPSVGRRCVCVERVLAREAAHRRLGLANIPFRYAEAHVDRFNLRDGSVSVPDPDRGGNSMRSITQRETDERARDRVRSLGTGPLSPGSTIIFIGPFGAGKTYLACALLIDQILRHGRSGLYVSAFTYVSALMPEALEAPVRRALMKHVRSVDVLLIDDLGVEKGSAFTMRELFSVIDDRYSSGKATLITSNLRMDDLFRITAKTAGLPADGQEAVALGRRIYSRLSQDRDVIEWPEGTTDYRPVAFRARAQRSNIARFAAGLDDDDDRSAPASEPTA